VRVERPATFGAFRAGQTDQLVSALDTDRNTAVKELVPEELRNPAVQQPKNENTTNDDDRDRQDQVACPLTNRQSKARHDVAKHERQRQREPDRSSHCHKICRSSNQLARGSSHGPATLVVTRKQPEFRVTSQIEMTSRAPKSSEPHVTTPSPSMSAG
jgi:hypothetical protein